VIIAVASEATGRNAQTTGKFPVTLMGYGSDDAANVKPALGSARVSQRGRVKAVTERVTPIEFRSSTVAIHDFRVPQ
jgi:hypothetical protein